MRSRLHRRLPGNWAVCKSANCGLPIHVADYTAAELEAMPFELLLPLLNALEPPSQVSVTGVQSWYNSSYRPHRYYDLPALVSPDGTMHWYRNGLLHRVGGQPAIIRADGTREWWTNGLRLLATGKPTGDVIDESALRLEIRS